MTHCARGDQGADCTRRQMAKFVVALDDKVAPTDIEEGMRVGVDRSKFKIKVPLPPKIDPSVRSLWPAVPVLGSSLFAAPLPTTQVTMMTVEEKPDVTYDDVGGAEESLEKLREVVELPLLHPERFVSLGIDPPKVRTGMQLSPPPPRSLACPQGVLLYGPPGTGKTLSARAVANRTDATFIRVIGSELVQKYIGEGARMVRELFQMARARKACIIFFDEVRGL